MYANQCRENEKIVEFVRSIGPFMPQAEDDVASVTNGGVVDIYFFVDEREEVESGGDSFLELAYPTVVVQ